MRYRPVPGGPRTLWLVLVPLAGVAAAFVASAEGETTRRTPLWLEIGFPLAIVGAGFWWAARLAAELVLEGDVLCERRLLGERRVPLADVTAVRPTAWSPNVAVFEVRQQRAIVTVGTKGLAGFVAEVERRRPGLPVRFGWQTRLSERLPGRSHTTDR